MKISGIFLIFVAYLFSMYVLNLTNSNDLYKQCYNCQLFNHSSEFCTLKPACVKFSGDHKSGGCKVTDRKSIKCANYDANHTANFRIAPKTYQVVELPQLENRTNSFLLIPSRKIFLSLTPRKWKIRSRRLF